MDKFIDVPIIKPWPLEKTVLTLDFNACIRYMKATRMITESESRILWKCIGFYKNNSHIDAHRFYSKVHDARKLLNNKDSIFAKFMREYPVEVDEFLIKY